MAAAIYDLATAAHAEPQPGVRAKFTAKLLQMVPTAHATALRLQSGPSVADGTNL